MENRFVDRGYAADRRRNKGEIPDERHPDEPNPRRRTPWTTESQEEFAVLVGVGEEQLTPEGTCPMLDELAELARTAGARIVGRMWQRRNRPVPRTYLGSGKAVELKELCESSGANMVITDTELVPAQVRFLEETLDLRVIDRSELIIDIFATHARTQQARLQVELAQLKYLAPRLKRMWTHLSRITGAGGIGSRGPGEKQIEVDRRIIQRRIRDLTRELAEIAARRDRQVSNRQESFKVSLVGYTNAGKSTLMRRLTGADVLVEDKLFATLDTRTRRWQLDQGLECLLSDTVGFIEKLPHHLVASFHATLAEVREADLLLHVVDAGDPQAAQRVETVRRVLKEIDAHQIPEVLLLNKCDRLPDRGEASLLLHSLDAQLLISARTGEGMEDLADLIQSRVTQAFSVLELDVPAGQGRLLARLSSVGHIISQEYEGDRCHLVVSVPNAVAPEFEPFLKSS